MISEQCLKIIFLSMYIFSVWSFPCGDIYAEGFWFTNKLLFELFNANSGIIGNISFFIISIEMAKGCY